MKIKFTRFFPVGGGQVLRFCVVEWDESRPIPPGAEATDDDITDWQDAEVEE